MIKELINKLRDWLRPPTFTKPVEVPDPFPTLPKTLIKIFLGDQIIGAIQYLTIFEYDNGNPHASAYRVRLDRTHMAEIFSRGFPHVASQRIPFKITIEDEGTVTIINNAWITSLPGYSYTTGDWVIIEEMVLEAESIVLQPKLSIKLKRV